MRWIVDAMNVIGSRPDKWWNDPDRAMRSMVAKLDEFARSTGRDIVCVLDKDPGDIPQTDAVEVVVARRRGRNAADHTIEEIVAEADDASTLRVVTSDRRLAESVRALGAKVVSSGRYRAELDKAVSGGP